MCIRKCWVSFIFSGDPGVPGISASSRGIEISNNCPYRLISIAALIVLLFSSSVTSGAPGPPGPPGPPGRPGAFASSTEMHQYISEYISMF